jgi:WD40 repeat protein
MVTAQPLLSLATGLQALHSIAFSPDGKILVVGGELGLQLRDAGDGRLIATLSHEAINCLAVSAQGPTIATGWTDHTIKFWNPPELLQNDANR